jgi:hypothetical protein
LITDSLLIFNNFASLIKRVEGVEGVERSTFATTFAKAPVVKEGYGG